MIAPYPVRILARTIASLLLGASVFASSAAPAPKKPADPPKVRREVRGRKVSGDRDRDRDRDRPSGLGDGQQNRPDPDEKRDPHEHKMERGASFDGDLRSLGEISRVKKRERPEREEENRIPVPYPGTNPGAPSRQTVDGGVQAQSAPAPGPSASFEGLDFATWGAGHPPDTNGDVGPAYYIETVNTSIGIYDKASGTRVAAFTFDAFMSQGNFGNLCDTDNFGDPVVLYDTFEDRWVITDFAFQLDGANNVINPPGAFQCFAVSKTGDPVTGGWNFYSINTTGGLGDYPKLGIWPDGLYMSVNMFGYAASGSFQNVRLYALNKTQMYAGAPNVQVVSFDAPASEFTLLPSNARLQTGTPPTGSPNYFSSVGIFTNALEVFKFHVDWNSVSASTFTGPFTTATPVLSQLTATTVPSPANRIDTLYPRTMMQNQYSNIGGVESLWNSHTVGASGTSSAQAAVRFYQVKITGGAVEPSATQAFTYSPDATLHRFLPSVAVNRAGDMAIGYSTSAAGQNPAIKYAGRLAADPVNSITQTETTLIQGTGTQSGNCGSSSCTRWGDYSAMTLDPDGCSFWYTNEYYQVTGLNDRTRIGAFSFPSCSPLSLGSLQGTVKTAAAVPIAGATVTLGSRTATTDGSGNYSFPDLAAGTYPGESASAAGFISASFSAIAVPSGGTATRNFVLNAAPLAGCFTDTTQADFQGGAATNCDVNGTPGSVTLIRTAAADQQNASVTLNGFGFNNTSWAGQTFTSAVTGQLMRVDLDLFCSSCTGTTPNLTVSIRATSGNPPVPTGADLAVATIPGFSSASGGYFTANFATPATLTAGTRYAVIIRPVSNPSAGVYAYVCSCGSGNSGTNPYANGQRVTSTTSGGAWAADTTSGGRDLGFITYMQGGFAASGNFVSSIKDANPPGGGAAAWGNISWSATVPAGTTLRFQAAASNSASGPFTFVGPDGTAATFFTSGASLAQFNGKRYLKYQALLTTTNGSVTPTINDVSICFANSTSTGPATVAPGSVTFAGKRFVGTTSAAAPPVTITNSGPGALVFTSFNGVAPLASFTVGTDFPATTNCPLTAPGLASGASCQFTFSFSPVAAGTRNATLTIVTNASNSPHTVTLSGFAFVVDAATVSQTVISGGTRLQQLQNADGGWYFGATATDCGAGAGVSCPNTIGVTALGLVSAYQRSGNSTTLAAAVAAGNKLVALYNADPTHPPYSQDLEYLIALGVATGNPLYANTAAAWFQAVTTTFPVAADRADWSFAERDGEGLRSLAVWDIASLIRSAKSVGQVDYALALANRVRAREADWKDVNPAHRWDQCSNTSGCGPADNPLAFDYTLLGMGSFLWAVHDLPGFDTQITQYRSHLLAQQDAAGSWDVGDLQITSYDVLGLGAVGSADAAVQSAAAFFIANQLPSNGWPYYAVGDLVGGEYTEVDSEVDRAVAMLFSTQSGSSVHVTPAQLSTVEFTTVSAPGATTVVALDNAAGNGVPLGYSLVGGLSYAINTTAVVGGNITTCLTVPWAATAGEFANLRILHAEQGQFVDRTITTGPNAPDAASKRVCALVSGLDAFAVAVRDPNAVDTTAPQISVTLSPSVLSTARNQLVTVTATITVSDNVDPSPVVTLVSITSSDGSTGSGPKADVQGAAFGTDDRSFQLRAESGKNDRIYTVTYRATDASGNSQQATATVTVRK